MFHKSSNRKVSCKVCFDAGKPESLYNSHRVKDNSGKTTCPTLLNTECRYCFKLGHTIKFCDVLANKNRSMDKPPSVQLPISIKKTAEKNRIEKKHIGFAALYVDSDTDTEIEEFKEVKVEEKPVIANETKNTWAAIAAKPKPEPVDDLLGMVVLTKKSKKPQPVEVKPVDVKPAPWCRKNTPVVKRRWSDWSDSENEDNEGDISPLSDCLLANEDW